ncbi:MAG: hypothetical protein ABIF04_01770 [Chloroflexota bacterium]
MTQKWEYKFLKGERNPIIEFDQDAGFEVIRKYEEELVWSEDGKSLDTSVGITTVINGLGMQGWELVTALPRSRAKSMGTMGTTTEELWVFKREKVNK